MALFYQSGIKVEKDLKEAIYWYTKSAEQGNADAQYNLAVCYDNGNGVERNLDMAIEYYKKAAEQGNEMV